MAPKLVVEIPVGSDWFYEIKYDGFRAILNLDHSSIKLTSRNGLLLNQQFPEIISFCSKKFSGRPLILDGEIVILDSPIKANFAALQKRGRLKLPDKILEQVSIKRAHYLAFDILSLDAKSLKNDPYIKRKEVLAEWIQSNKLLLKPNPGSTIAIQMVESTTNHKDLWATVLKFDGEGIIAKRKNSAWIAGKKTNDWLKIKNWKRGLFFVIGLDKSNGFIHVGVKHDTNIMPVGLFTHGIPKEYRSAIYQVIEENKIDEASSFINISPGICVELLYLELYKGQIRQPMFAQFRFDLSWEDCTWEKLIEGSSNA